MFTGVEVNFNVPVLVWHLRSFYLFLFPPATPHPKGSAFSLDTPSSAVMLTQLRDPSYSYNKQISGDLALLPVGRRGAFLLLEIRSVCSSAWQEVDRHPVNANWIQAVNSIPTHFLYYIFRKQAFFLNYNLHALRNSLGIRGAQEKVNISLNFPHLTLCQTLRNPL